MLCAIAPSGWMLVGARFAQGLGAALFMPSSLGLLTYAYPDGKLRARMLGLWSAIVSLSAVSGPLVGGVIITFVGWRGVFWINVPIGLIGIWLASRHLPVTPGRPQPLALLSHACGTVALAGLAYALIQGPSDGWSTTPVLAALAACAAASLCFVRQEWRSTTPVLPRALVRDGRFRRINGTGLLLNLGAYGTLFLVSLYDQQVRHAGPLRTGLDLLPLMLMFTVGNLLTVRLAPRYGHHLPLRLGLSIACVATAALCTAVLLRGSFLPAWLLDLSIALANVGIGIAVPAMTTAMMSVAHADDANTAAAALNANRQLGSLLGVATVGAVLHGQTDWSAALPLSLGLLAAAYVGALAACWRKRP